MKKIKAIVCDHMDLTWRRAFDRDMVFKGQNFVSYAKLEEYYILDNIKLARKYPQYKFTIESNEVVRKFLERNPMYEDELKKLYSEGRISTMFTGNNIIDVNLCNGESIVRNYLYGKRWMKKLCSKPSGVCQRTDAFGNSAQMPQIIRGFDCKYIGKISYSKCDGNYWRGLDGTTVVTTPVKIVFESGGYYKYPPCPECNGYGCKKCDYRGIDAEHVKPQIIPMDRMDLSKVTGEGAEYILCGGEELMPREDIIEFAERHKNEVEVVFSTYDELLEDSIDLSKVDNPPENELASSVEMNTNNTGVYATRIKMKQRLRKTENMMTAAETLNVMNYVNGGNPHAEEIEEIWRKINFTMFHDAVTATHVDAAFDELMDIFDEVQGEIRKINSENLSNLSEISDGVTVFNPTGDCVEKIVGIKPGFTFCDEIGNELDKISDTEVICRLNPYETKYYNLKEKKFIGNTKKTAEFKKQAGDSILTDVVKETEKRIDAREFFIENERYKITAEIHGIKSIYDKILGINICEETEYMPFEFILEHDDGSPWATMSSDLRRTTFRNDTLLTEIETSENCSKLKFKISLPDRVIAYSVTGIGIEYEIVLYKNSDKVYMNCKIFWDTINHRLRIAVPVPFAGRDMYEIPYGYLERKEYGLSRFREGREQWAAAINEYPAINWAGIEGEQASVCLFNQGTPSHYITDNNAGGRTIFVTPLRSPGNATYLHDPAAYSMTDWDGMRDAGTHEFSYMLGAYAEGFDKNNAVPDGNSFNARLFVENGRLIKTDLPILNCGGARIVSLKNAEDDKAVIVRMAEYHGKSENGSLSVPEYVKSVCQTNLDERELENLELNNNTVRLNFRPFEIKTVKMNLK